MSPRASVGLVAAVAVVMMLLMAEWFKLGKAAREAVYNERLRVLAVERDSLREVKARRDTAYRTDTIKQRRVETRYRTLVDSILRVDTLTVREQVIVNASDDALKACRVSQETCEARVADRDRIIANERKTRATSDSLHRVEMKQARPHLLPYVEAGVDPLHQWSATGRAGLEVRLIGPTRLIGALHLTTAPTTLTSAVVGVRLTF